MRQFLQNLDRHGERWLLLIFYSMIVATVFIEVIRRFVLSYSSIWGEEIARYAFIYLAWIGASAAVRDRAHIRIDLILHYLKPRGRAVIYLFGDFLTFLLAVIALYWSLHPIFTSPGIRLRHPWIAYLAGLVHRRRAFGFLDDPLPTDPIDLPGSPRSQTGPRCVFRQ